MSRKQLAIVGSIVGLVLIAIIVLLATGGSPSGQLAQLTKDARGDAVVSDGVDPPRDLSLADVHEARVELIASQIVFQAEMAAPIPKRLPEESLEWSWEILEGGSETWTVSAEASGDNLVASVLQEQGRYGASTNDNTLPGGVDYSGNTIFVRLNAQQIEGFPTVFTWRLITSLDGDRDDPASAAASDTAPESGLGEYPPPS